jgi:hypothetical protein
MDGLGERVVTWALRAASTALVFAGFAFFVAGIPVFSATSGAARDILVVVFQIGGAWALLGLTAIFTTRRRSLARPPGVIVAMALILTLIAIAMWLVWRLQPFLSEWRVLADLASSSNFFETANANMSGVVLLPIFAALTPPLIQLAALAAFVVSSIVMLLLLVAKSPRFSHLFVATVLVLTALVVGSARGASAVSMAVEALQPLIEESKARPQEYAEIRAIVDRYTAAVTPTATALGWAWLGYAIWIPPLFLMARRP